MKKILLTIILGVLVAIPSKEQSPLGRLEFYSNNYCSKSINSNNQITLRPKTHPQNPTYNIQNQNTRNYSFAELNGLEFDSLIDLIVTLEWSEIDGLFEFSDGSFEFYSDTDRMQALFDAVEIRGNTYTVDDHLGIDVLVEVIRSGFYLAFYYEELNFLREPEIMNNTISGMDAICNNPNFGFGTDSQTKIIKAFGAYQGIGITSINSLLKSANIFNDVYSNFESYIQNWEISNSIYWLGDGVYYSLYSAHYNSSNQAEETIFYGEIDSLFNAIAQIGLIGTITSDNEWLLNNAVWWNARIGKFVDNDSPVQFLTDIVELYGQWTEPGLEAIEMLCYLYDCQFADGTPIDEEEIIQELHDWLLPNRTTFDDGKIIFKTGSAVTSEKIETLYWAMKEVESQFFRVTLNDVPLEQGNADDSLIAIIYSSPDDYQYNNFLYGLSTNNGGIYIESWGTFFTYERTPQESIYTLEDLFRHEYTHYLQGRYLSPGMWWGHPIYDDERLTWFEEGEAEFLAGSTRLNGIQTRLSMVENIAWNEADRMNLGEVVNAQYGSWSFYTYGFAFFDYMYKNRLDLLLEMINYIKSGDGDSFDILMNQIENDEELNVQYQLHMDNLKNNQDSFVNPETVGSYFDDTGPITLDLLVDEITDATEIFNPELNYIFSNNHTLFSINGQLSLEFNNQEHIAWTEINDYTNTVLTDLNNLDWNGYGMVNSWFSEPVLNENNQLTYHINIQGKISLDQFSEVFGCTDSLAFNYNPEATVNDNSCEYYSGPVWHVNYLGNNSTADGSYNNPFSLIQSAVNVSSSGDTILVADGHYYETVSIAGKDIVLISQNGPENTIIDGDENDSESVILVSEWGNAVSNEINGFTIQNSIYGIYSDFDYADRLHKVKNCIIISNNKGIHVNGYGNWRIENTLFYDNNIGFSNGYYGDNCLILNSTFNNDIDIEFNPNYDTTVELNIYNSIFTGMIYSSESNPVYLYYSNFVEDNIDNNVNLIEGNITENPLFVDIENKDYTLQNYSPCIDAGIADINNDGVNDLTDYLGAAPDMGYAEWYPYLIGDINLDDVVNVVDIILIVNMIMGDIIIEESADINNDGVVNIIDIVLLVQFILDE